MIMDDDDEDAPLVFKRKASSQKDLEAIKCTPKRRNGQSWKGAFGVYYLALQNSGFFEHKPLQTPMAEPASPKDSTLSANAPTITSPPKGLKYVDAVKDEDVGEDFKIDEDEEVGGDRFDEDEEVGEDDNTDEDEENGEDDNTDEDEEVGEDEEAAEEEEVNEDDNTDKDEEAGEDEEEDGEIEEEGRGTELGVQTMEGVEFSGEEGGATQNQDHGPSGPRTSLHGGPQETHVTSRVEANQILAKPSHFGRITDDTQRRALDWLLSVHPSALEGLRLRSPEARTMALNHLSWVLVELRSVTLESSPGVFHQFKVHAGDLESMGFEAGWLFNRVAALERSAAAREALQAHEAKKQDYEELKKKISQLELELAKNPPVVPHPPAPLPY